MKKDALISIIGNPIRARLIRLFVLNKEAVFDIKELQKTLKVSSARLTVEINDLITDEIVKRQKGIRRIEKKTKTKTKKMEVKEINESFIGVSFNKKCSFRSILEDLVLHTVPSEKDTLLRQLSQLTGLKVLVTTGIFVRDNDAIADIMIAGENLDEKEFGKIVNNTEQLVGREFRCAIFDMNDFVHRLNINDRTVRDILDYPHFVHIDRLGLLEFEK